MINLRNRKFYTKAKHFLRKVVLYISSIISDLLLLLKDIFFHNYSFEKFYYYKDEEEKEQIPTKDLSRRKFISPKRRRYLKSVYSKK